MTTTPSLPAGHLTFHHADYVTTASVNGRTVPVDNPTLRLVLLTPGHQVRNVNLTDTEALRLIATLADAIAKARRP